MMLEPGYPKWSTGPFAYHPPKPKRPERIEVRNEVGVLLGTLPLEKYSGEPYVRFPVMVAARWWGESDLDAPPPTAPFKVGQWSPGGERRYPCLLATPMHSALLHRIYGWKPAT